MKGAEVEPGELIGNRLDHLAAAVPNRARVVRRQAVDVVATGTIVEGGPLGAHHDTWAMREIRANVGLLVPDAPNVGRASGIST